MTICTCRNFLIPIVAKSVSIAWLGRVGVGDCDAATFAVQNEPFAWADSPHDARVAVHLGYGDGPAGGGANADAYPANRVRQLVRSSDPLEGACREPTPTKVRDHQQVVVTTSAAVDRDDTADGQ